MRILNQTLWISWITIRDLFHEKSLGLIIFFSLLGVGLSLLLGQLTYTNQSILTCDFMLGFSRITLLLFSVFMTLQIHRKELLTQSIWMLLAKPIPRISYIVGKYLGLLVVLFMLAFSMGLVIGGFLFFIDDKMALLSVFQTQLLLTLECGVLCAFTLLCAVLTGPLLAASFSISFWILASSHQPLNLVFSHKTNNPIWNLLKRGVPDFSLFDIRVHVPYGFQLSFQDIISLSFYGMCSVVFFLSIAAVLFENKDISA